MDMFKGKAETEASGSFLNKHNLEASQKRSFCGVLVSSIGLGTYLGNMDEVTDYKVSKAIIEAVNYGCNFIDTAINYRGQRAECSVGEAIRQLILSQKLTRQEIFISTKGGFVPFNGKPVQNLKVFFEQEYVSKETAAMSDLIAGCHCMEPKYIRNQVERSRTNLQLDTIDLYYLHNPETQLEELSQRILFEKLYDAFQELERLVKENKIVQYGLATWSAFRDETGSQTSVQLEKCLALSNKAAKKEGFSESHFKAIQLPFNLAMPEAGLLPTQKVQEKSMSAVAAAKSLGLNVAVSVPLFQSRLCHGLPESLIERFPKDTHKLIALFLLQAHGLRLMQLW